MNAPQIHHGKPGRVTRVMDEQDGKHATIEVTHGKRKRSRGPDGQPGELQSYSQPTSRITLPKADAKHYPLGKKVYSGLGPMDDADQDSMDDDTDGDMEQGEPQSAPPPTFAKKGSKRGKPAAKKGKGKKAAKKAAPPPSMIASAMMQGR